MPWVEGPGHLLGGKESLISRRESCPVPSLFSCVTPTANLVVE